MRLFGFATTGKTGLAFLALTLALAATPLSAAGLAIEKPLSPTNLRPGEAVSAPVSDEMSAAVAPTADAAMPPAEATLPPLPMPGAPANDPLANFGSSSGTVVGNRAMELRDEVLRLRSSVNLNAGEFTLLRANGAAGAVQYHSTVAAITARLQNGTTRGNPILLRQWDEAEGSLNEVTSSLNRLNALQTSISADASLASYLLESVQAAFQLAGAVDEDHDQLKSLRDEVSRMVARLDHLRNQVAEDIQRQTTYLSAERSNIQTLAFAISRGELLGSSLANRPVLVTPASMMAAPAQPAAAPPAWPTYSPAAVMPPPPAVAPPTPSLPPPGPAPMSPREVMQESDTGAGAPPAGAVVPSLGRLLVLIRYNQPVVEYEQQLSSAVSSMLQRQPNAEFSVVGVTPASGEPSELATAQEAANRNAEAVKRSLVQLGLAPSRINVASTQTQAARTAEVHVYVR